MLKRSIMLYMPCTISWLAPGSGLLRIVVVLRKRLSNILTIGGVMVLSLVPSIARAEDDSVPRWQDSPAGRFITNVNALEPIPVNTTGTTASRIPGSDAPRTLTASVPDLSESVLRNLVDSISKDNGVDPALIDAMVRTESNYNPLAISSKGARGLMQLIPETGRRFGVQDFFDPRQNIEGGVRYIKFLLNMFDGNVDLSLAAYNAGENIVARLGRIPPYPETKNYVRKIRILYAKPYSYVTPSLEAVTAQTSPVVSANPATSGPTAGAAIDPAVPISKWMDGRGVRHFSNLEPVN